MCRPTHCAPSKLLHLHPPHGLTAPAALVAAAGHQESQANGWTHLTATTAAAAGHYAVIVPMPAHHLDDLPQPLLQLDWLGALVLHLCVDCFELAQAQWQSLAPLLQLSGRKFHEVRARVHWKRQLQLTHGSLDWAEHHEVWCQPTALPECCSDLADCPKPAWSLAARQRQHLRFQACFAHPK